MHEFIEVARSGLWAPGRIETTALGVGVRVKEAGGGEGRNMSNIFCTIVCLTKPLLVVLNKGKTVNSKKRTSEECV